MSDERCDRCGDVMREHLTIMRWQHCIDSLRRQLAQEREARERADDSHRFMTELAGDRGRKLERAQAENAHLRALLGRLEWVQETSYALGEWYGCPVCSRQRADGHAPDCTLAAALSGSAGEVGALAEALQDYANRENWKAITVFDASVCKYPFRPWAWWLYEEPWKRAEDALRPFLGGDAR